MSNDPTRFKRVTVNVDLGRGQAYLSVLTVVRDGGSERRNLIWRGVLPLTPRLSTAREIIELARTALERAADRL